MMRKSSESGEFIPPSEQKESQAEEKERIRQLGHAYFELVTHLANPEVSQEEKEKELHAVVSDFFDDEEAAAEGWKRVTQRLDECDTWLAEQGNEKEQIAALFSLLKTDEESLAELEKEPIELRKIYQGIYHMVVPYDAFNEWYIRLKNSGPPQAAAARPRTGEIDFLITRNTDHPEETVRKYLQRGEKENLHHELHHVIWHILKRTDVRPKPTYDDPEMARGFSNYQDELLARLLTTDLNVAMHYSKDKQVIEKSRESSVLLAIAKGVGKQKDIKREDFIGGLMLVRNYDELQRHIVDVVKDISINDAQKKHIWQEVGAARGLFPDREEIEKIWDTYIE